MATRRPRQTGGKGSNQYQAKAGGKPMARVWDPADREARQRRNTAGCARGVAQLVADSGMTADDYDVTPHVYPEPVAV